MSLKEKQATAKLAFAFPGELTNKYFCVAESRALQERICEFEVECRIQDIIIPKSKHYMLDALRAY